MKQLLFLIIILHGILHGLAQQDPIKIANDCYNKKNYGCAIDNYLMAIEKKTYKEGDLYLLEFRIAYAYSSLERYDKAKEYYLKSIALKSDYMNAYWYYADDCYNTENYTDAATNYKKAFDLAVKEEDKDIIALWAGNANKKLKRYETAIANFSKVKSRTGDFYNIDAFIADAYFDSKKYDSAINYYTIATPYYQPKDTTIITLKYNLGRAYRLAGKRTEALQAQDTVLKINPKFGSAYWEKGIVFAVDKNYSTAIDMYKKAFQFTVDSVESYTLSGNISACYHKLNNYTEMLNWEQKQKNFSRNKYKEFVNIASIQYGLLKQAKEAEKTCKEAIAQFEKEAPEKIIRLGKEDFAKLNAIAGKIALERKDTTQATAFFETALKINKGNFEANAGAANIAWARKKEADYKKYFADIYKSSFDTLLTTNKEIANVYGRSAHADVYINKYKYYNATVETALKYDSLQKEALLLWPLSLTSGSTYTLSSKRAACISIINQGIKQYAADKSFVSDLYNAKAVVLDTKDTVAIRTALQEAVKMYPENIKAWDNLLKYYTSYDNATGAIVVDKLIAIVKKQKDTITTAAAYVYKGDFLWRTDKKEDAKKAWQEALVWDSNNASAKERIKM